MSYQILSTLQCKTEQLRRGYFQSGSGPEIVLLLGSCRTLAYTNYLVRWNETIGNNRLTIIRIDPCDFNWNAADEIVDGAAAIRSQEENPALLEILRGTGVFIHEHLESYGMFNTRADAEKNIFQFGIVPRVDCCLPNFHDHFVLFNEQLQFDEKMKDAYCMSSENALHTMRARGLAALEKFYSVCRLSSFPELENEMRDNWMKRRFFWTGNHVSKEFTLFLFKQMNDRFLKLPMDGCFWNGAGQEDQFSKPCTPVTQHDVDAYGITWPDTPIEPLKI